MGFWGHYGLIGSLWGYGAITGLWDHSGVVGPLWGHCDMGLWDHYGVVGPLWGSGAIMGFWGHGVIGSFWGCGAILGLWGRWGPRCAPTCVSASRICSSANRRPTQLRFPTPKGREAKGCGGGGGGAALGGAAAAAEGRSRNHRSGRNASGAGNERPSRDVE